MKVAIIIVVMKEVGHFSSGTRFSQVEEDYRKCAMDYITQGFLHSILNFFRLLNKLVDYNNAKKGPQQLLTQHK
mgnify:CR=1 FL=1